jgi:oxygen-independent coproporphyrinogen-3 oxidase
LQKKDEDAASAYVHLPFCKKKCFYCDFPVVATGKDTAPGSEAASRFDRYVDKLIKEMQAYQVKSSEKEEKESSSNDNLRRPLKTVFFGGGTPSLIPPAQLERILDSLRDIFGIDADAEVSMEADPGTFDRQKLRDFSSLGINRISMGVQSFDSKLLEVCGRSHNVVEVYQAIDDMHAVSPPSWSIDLMFGLPHQTLQTWEHTLGEAIKADPHHVSCYDLQIEESTPFARWYEVGAKPLPDEETGADFFKMASERLGAADFLHYEISNYAKAGHECKHNRAYWHNDPFYAFGLGATSYLHQRRIKRPRKMKEYETWVDQGQPIDKILQQQQEQDVCDTKEDRLLDSIMLSLRLSEGLLMEGLDERFGVLGVEDKIWKGIKKYKAERLVQVEEGGKRIRLTDPDGFLVSNSIISDIFASLD